MIFPTALISHSLQFLQDQPETEAMLARSASFLLNQIGRGAVWNHFTNTSVIWESCPYDLDDTVCVSSFLVRRFPYFKQSANKKLICDNRNSDGLFYTWFTFRPRWHRNSTYWLLALRELKHPIKSFYFWKHEAGRYDLDTVVNANVLYYLGDIEETGKVIKHLIRIIEEKQEFDCDKWYRNPFSVYYFISRNLFAGIAKLEAVRQPIIERILSTLKPDGRLGNSVLDTALGICSLFNLNYNDPQLEKSINFLISNQGDTGEWERWLFYYGGPKKLAGYGCEELTTAFCLEALSRFNQTIK